MPAGNLPLEFLDLTSFTLEEAHFRLGREVQSCVHRRLNTTFNAIDAEASKQASLRVRKICSFLKTRAEDRSTLGVGIRCYLHCCERWAEGAQLADYSHPKIEKSPLHPLELAMLLQLENIGCQTGIYRCEDGSSIFWHTEEDIDPENSRFDKFRIVAFACDGLIINTFIYPDLLPGPAFSWTDAGVAFAVDSILAKSDIAVGYYPNLVYWLVLFYQKRIAPETLIPVLSPKTEAGAVFVVRAGSDVRAEKYEFVAEEMLTAELGVAPGSYLFQTNVFSRAESEACRKYEPLQSTHRHSYDERATRTEAFLKSLDKPSLEDFYRLLTSTQGGDYAYANPDVKAHFLYRAEKEGCEIWVGGGLAKKSRYPLRIRRLWIHPL